MTLHEFRIAVRNIQMDIIQPEPLDLVVVGARDNVRRGQLPTRRIESRH
jgi:hypothetical protein